MLYDIATKEGEQVSATVFVGGKQFLATPDHPNWTRIITILTDPPRSPDGILGPDYDKKVQDLFDVSVAIGGHFTRLSERVTANRGRLYMDGVEVDSALGRAILRYYLEGNDDLRALVNFMEKIETNRSPHSRKHLFRWMSKHNFAICPDGDFIAYKGIDLNDMSTTSGRAIVNGRVINGCIPNVADTVIEMPRNEVTFDPRNGCSTGLHVANWAFAVSWSQRTVRVKVNPRDVVSVPVDSNAQKMRVCRYRVLNIVTAEDRTALYVNDPERTAKLVEKQVQVALPAVPAKRKKAGTKKPVELKFPKYYEDFRKAHFDACAYAELRWLAKEWETRVGSSPTKSHLVARLTTAAAGRRRQGLGSGKKAG